MVSSPVMFSRQRLPDFVCRSTSMATRCPSCVVATPSGLCAPTGNALRAVVSPTHWHPWSQMSWAATAATDRSCGMSRQAGSPVGSSLGPQMCLPHGHLVRAHAVPLSRWSRCPSPRVGLGETLRDPARAIEADYVPGSSFSNWELARKSPEVLQEVGATSSRRAARSSAR